MFKLNIKGLLKMLRKVSILFLGVSMTASVVASGPQSDYELYKSDRHAYYAQHPAVTDDANRRGFETLQGDLIVQVARHLNWMSARNYLFLSKKIFAQKNKILICQLANFYNFYGYNYDDVFLELDHPHWTPKVLPDDVTVKLHYGWFFRANKLSIKANPSSEQQLEKFRLYYSAGCLGHMLAAREAGQMLMNPDLNDLLPLVVSYDELQPEAKVWDICRLSRKETDNIELITIMDRIPEVYSDSESEDEDGHKKPVQNQPEKLSLLKDLVVELKAIEQTEEVKAVMIALEEMVEFLGSNVTMEGFLPVKAIAYAKQLNLMTPLLAQIIGIEIDSDDEAEEAKQTVADYHLCLNADNLEGYADLFDDQIRILTPDAEKKNSFTSTAIYSNAAMAAFEEQRRLYKIVYLLGGSYPYILYGTDNIDAALRYEDLEKWNALRDHDMTMEVPVNVFLCYLALTRKNDGKTYEELRAFLKEQLVSYTENSGNSARVDLLDKHFNYVVPKE